MGRLLDKIKAQGAADLRTCGKQVGATLTESATVAESCGFQSQIKHNPQNLRNLQNPQSLRTLIPAPNIAFHKSANPQGAPVDSEGVKPEEIRCKHPASPKKRLIQLAVEEGIYEHGLKLAEQELAALVPPSDWKDTEHCTSEELKAWAIALALRAIRYRGQVPTGWDQIAVCKNCGPVYSFVVGECMACPWCEQKHTGKWFPQPEQAA
jgi:hypothetical protein